MAFLRVVEVLPPLFSRSGRSLGDAKATFQRFMADVGRVAPFADIVLVANVKDPTVQKPDIVSVSTQLNGRGFPSVPVVVVRDQNRSQFLSAVLTAFSMGLEGVMVAWGDDFPPGVASNVRDFGSLADAISEAARVRRRLRSPAKLFAPVNVEALSNRGGVAFAKRRLAAGADILLAQPPTTDAEETLERHIMLLEGAGLRGKTLLNVFPFTSPRDVARIEELFGWKLASGVGKAARGGQGEIIKTQRNIVRRMRHEGLPGVYLSTRGDVGLAEKILS